MEEKKVYSLGFCFDDDGYRLALMRKLRPSWQAGKFNGIGGQLEKDENILDCMIREFKEETGVNTNREDWHLYLTLDGEDFRVYCFNCFDTNILNNINCEQTDEHIEIFETAHLGLIAEEFISNLPWMISLCLDSDMRRMSTMVHYEPR